MTGTAAIEVLAVGAGAETESLAVLVEHGGRRMTVEQAADAATGLEYVAEHGCDCVVSAYDLGETTGIEFLEAVRASQPALPFVLCAADGSERVAAEALSAGVTDYLPAGDDEELAERVRDAVEQHRTTRLARQLRPFVDEAALPVTVEGADGSSVTLTEDSLRRPPAEQESEPEQSGGGRLSAAGELVVKDKDESQVLEGWRQTVEEALDELDELFYVLDTDGRLRRWNTRFSTITGYSESALDGMHATELFPEDERATVADAIGRVLAGEQVTVEAEFLTGDGERRPYEFTGHRLPGSAGDTAGIVGIGRDLTELREQQRRFRALIERSPDLLTVADADAQFQYASPSWQTRLGYDPEELVGDTVWEYVHPDDREQLAAAFEEGLANPDARPVEEFRVQHADGSWRWLEARGNNQLDNPAVEGYVVNKRDITERKRREQELTRQRDRLAAVFDAVPHAVTEVEFQGGEPILASVNDAFEERFGYERERVVGESADEVIVPEEFQGEATEINRSAKRGEEVGREVERVTADGERRTFLFRSAEVSYGDVAHWIGTYIDITERKKRERKLEQLREFFREAERLGTLGAWELDEDDTVFWTNGAKRIHGLDDTADMSLEEAFEFVHPEDRAKIREIATAAFENREPYDAELRIIADDGDQRWVRVSGSPVESEDDSHVFRGFIQDITEQTEREQELLRKSRAIESVPVGVSMTDPAEEDNPIIYVNDHYESLTGHTRSEVYGENHRFMQGERTAAEPVAQMRAAVDAQEPVSVELRNYRKDGTEFWNHVEIAPVFDEDDELVNYVGFQQDITERKRHEQQIQVLNRILRHNLRNRLSVARAYVSRVASTLDEPSEAGASATAVTHDDTDAALDALDELQQLGEKARQLHSAMEASAEGDELELTSLLSDLITDIHRGHPAASVTLDPSEAVAVSVSPNLELALREVLENAVTHGAEPASVTVCVETTDDTVEIVVSDDGSELSTQDRRVLTGGEEASLTHSSGLGLWMVHWIVTSHGGSVDAAVDETGTTVTVSLPRSDTEMPPISLVTDPELQQARDRFEAVFEESFDAMAITDSEGRYIEVNSAATDLFGREERELLGHRPDELTDGMATTPHLTAAGSADERDQFNISRPDGSERTIEYSVTPDIVPNQHLFLFRDITERKRREEKLTARTAELERQNQRLKEFASVVSHDLRNPLNVATKELERARAEDDSDALARVETAHRRMNELIGDVLDLARAGRELGDLAPIELTGVVAQAWQHVESTDAKLAVPTDCTLEADFSRLQQLVENLLRNAIEHGGDEVRLTVSKRDAGDGFYVSDDGPGIPDDERDAVFESGYSTQDDGTGFGLAIVTEVAEAHGWTVEVSESEAGGARFDVTGVELG